MRHVFDERLQFGVGLRRGDVAAQAERDAESGIGILGDMGGSEDIGLGPGEARRHYADDLIRNVIETDCAAEDVGIAEEIVLPETVAEDGDVCRFLSRRGVRRNEPAAEERRNAEMVGIVGGDEEAADVFWKVAVGGGGIRLLESDDALERFELAELRDFRAGVARDAFVPLRIEEMNDREAIGVAIREGIDEDGVDDAEDGGGGADAECEGEDGGGGEGGAFAEFAEGVAEVGEHFLNLVCDWVLEVLN